jgi:hypothetical protein
VSPFTPLLFFIFFCTFQKDVDADNEDEMVLERFSPQNICISLETNQKRYELFEIRSSSIHHTDDVKRVAALVKKCYHAFIYGNYVYGTLCEFYDQLHFTGFNDLVVYDMAGLPNDKMGDRIIHISFPKQDRRHYTVTATDQHDVETSIDTDFMSYFYEKNKNV